MKKLTFSLLVGFTLTGSWAHAARVLEILERSHELKLANVTLPRTQASAIGYRQCGTCTYAYMHVSDATTWFVDGHDVSLEELGRVAAQIRLTSGAAERTLVVLHYDPHTEVATRIRLEQPQ